MSLKGTVNHGDGIDPEWGQSVENAIGGGGGTTAYPLQFSDYVFWKSGSTYYYRDGSSGRLFSSSYFDTLIQETIDEGYESGSGPGARITLKNSAYYAENISMYPGIHVYGTGRAGYDSDFTKLGTQIFAENDNPIFKFDPGASGYSYHWGLHSLWLDGDGNITNSAIVDINPTSYDVADVELDDLSVVQGKYGIRLNNATADKRIWNVKIRRCYLEANTANAILIDSSTNQEISQIHIGPMNHFYGNNTSSGNGALEVDGHECFQINVIGNTFRTEQKHGIYFNDEVDSSGIRSNDIVDAGVAADDTYSGIHVLDCDFITITGNTAVHRTHANVQKYGIYTDDNCTYYTLVGNTGVGDTAGINFGTGTGHIGDATMNVSLAI